MDDFSHYEDMRKIGTEPAVVYNAARANGLNPIVCIRMLRSVFNLSLIEAKEVITLAEKLSSSLDEYQGKMKNDLKQVLDNDDVRQAEEDS